MAEVAPRPKIIEIQPKVRALSDWNFVIGMEVPFAATEAVAQLSQYLLCRNFTQLELLEVFNDVRCPRAIHAPPTVTLKAKNPERAVVGIIAPIGCGWSARVLLSLVIRTPGPSVLDQLGA